MTHTRSRIRSAATVLGALTLLSGAAALDATTAHASTATDAVTSVSDWLTDTDEASSCDPIIWSNTSTKGYAAAAELLSHGWHTSSQSPASFLYSPAC